MRKENRLSTGLKEIFDLRRKIPQISGCGRQGKNGWYKMLIVEICCFFLLKDESRRWESLISLTCPSLPPCHCDASFPPLDFLFSENGLKILYHFLLPAIIHYLITEPQQGGTIYEYNNISFTCPLPHLHNTEIQPERCIWSVKCVKRRKRRKKMSSWWARVRVQKERRASLCDR